MNERFFTKEECERKLAKAQADMIIWMTFLKAIDDGDFVLIDDKKMDPTYRIVKHGVPIINLK